MKISIRNTLLMKGTKPLLEWKNIYSHASYTCIHFHSLQLYLYSHTIV